ncbi:predicted protein, partial [Nematostella vectensis]
MLYTVVVLAWLAHMTTGEPARKSKYLIQPKDCTHSIMYDCYEKEKPNLKGNIICLNFTEQMLKDQLKNAGGYNPRYMAANLYEALKFEDPSGWTYTTTTGPPLEGQQPISRRFRWPLEGPKRIIHPDSTAGRHRMKRMIGGAGECWEKGTQTQGSSRYHMCTFCHRITQLPDDQFPRYINEVVCRHSLGAASGAVTSDQFCVANAGECSQKILKLEGLIFTGYEPAPDLGNNIYKPKWETTTLNI